MLILIGDRILLTNLDFQLRNAKITRFWNRVFNGIGFIILLIFLFLQGFLSFNPQNIRVFDLYPAIKTAISFVTNTNWQVYSGETAVSYLTLMALSLIHISEPTRQAE